MSNKRDTTIGVDMLCGITQGREELSNFNSWLRNHLAPSPDISLASSFKLSILHVLEYTLTVGAQNRAQAKSVISQLKETAQLASSYPLELKMAGARLVHRTAPYGSKRILSVVELPNAAAQFSALREQTEKSIDNHLGYIGPPRWKQLIGIGIVVCRASSFAIAEDSITPLFDDPDRPALPDSLTITTPTFNPQRPETV